MLILVGGVRGVEEGSQFSPFQYPGVARSISSDVDNLLGLLRLSVKLPEGESGPPEIFMGGVSLKLGGVPKLPGCLLTPPPIFFFRPFCR